GFLRCVEHAHNLRTNIIRVKFAVIIAAINGGWGATHGETLLRNTTSNNRITSSVYSRSPRLGPYRVTNICTVELIIGRSKIWRARIANGCRRLDAVIKIHVVQRQIATEIKPVRCLDWGTDTGCNFTAFTRAGGQTFHG